MVIFYFRDVTYTLNDTQNLSVPQKLVDYRSITYIQFRLLNQCNISQETREKMLSTHISMFWSHLLFWEDMTICTCYGVLVCQKHFVPSESRCCVSLKFPVANKNRCSRLSHQVIWLVQLVLTWHVGTVGSLRAERNTRECVQLGSIQNKLCKRRT